MSEILNKLKEIKNKIQNSEYFWEINSCLSETGQIPVDKTNPEELKQIKIAQTEIIFEYSLRVCDFIEKWQEGKFKPTPTEVRKFQEIYNQASVQPSTDFKAMEETLKAQGFNESQTKSLVQKAKQFEQE